MLKTEAIDHDGLFKELLGTFFIEFVELFLPDVAASLDPNFALVAMDKEILADLNLKERHEVDLLMKVKFKGEDAYFLVHVENQATAQSDFPSRMYSYFARLTLKHKLPIYPVVIFSYDMPLRPEPAHFEVTFPRKRILRFDYTVIQLNRLSWRKFVRRDNPVANALMAKMKIAPKDRPRVKLECYRMLARLKLDPARATVISVFIENYLSLTAAEEKRYEREFSQLPVEEKETTMELMTIWERKGLTQGLTQGLEQGQLQGREAMLLRQIRKRFGIITEDATERLTKLSLEDLDELAEALLDFTDIADLNEWLTRHS